ncbi:PRC-barrel domain-containing protein [Streptosporangium vulgare]|uniref:PRC-barrel domain-containing protein n=1 Tax=Streptosporangium vulgare TaxID=46190 RepID=A0ABV5TL12_9ACTN
MTENVWSYRPEAYSGEQTLDLVGFDVEATDGKIGSVDEESNTVGDSYIVVDTGFWIFGKKVVLPAGTVHQIDPQERKIYVSRTKQEIKDAPEFDEATYKEPGYRDKLGGYYGPGAP